MSAAYPVVVQRSLLGSVVKGALAALGCGVAFGFALVIAAPDSAAPFFLLAVASHAPMIALGGAIGGIIVHYSRGPTTIAASSRVAGDNAGETPPLSFRIAGGIAGLQASSLSALFPAPISGEVAISLTPLWIMAGVALAWRVHRSDSSVKALGAGVIYAAVAHFGTSLLFWGITMLAPDAASPLPIDRLLKAVMGLGVGITVYVRMRRAE